MSGSELAQYRTSKREDSGQNTHMSPNAKSEMLAASFSSLTEIRAKSWISVQKLIVCMGDQQSKNKNKKEHNKKLTKDPPPPSPDFWVEVQLVRANARACLVKKG